MPALPPVPRQCLACQRPFLARAREVARGNGKCCSKHCSARLGAAATLTKYPQAGEANFNFKGWRSRDHITYVQRSQAKYPDRARARRIFAAAVSAGTLIRPDSCTWCGVACRPHGHHPDYAQPLVVEWVCRPCHLRHHHQARFGGHQATAAAQTAAHSHP
jgi:hypothetical protein